MKHFQLIILIALGVFCLSSMFNVYRRLWIVTMQDLYLYRLACRECNRTGPDLAIVSQGQSKYNLMGQFTMWRDCRRGWI